VLGQAPGLVAAPGLEGGEKLALVDLAVLQREQSEEEMAVGGGSANRLSFRLRASVRRHRRAPCNRLRPIDGARKSSRMRSAIDGQIESTFRV
jgi:hypothetical protein